MDATCMQRKIRSGMIRSKMEMMVRKGGERGMNMAEFGHST